MLKKTTSSKLVRYKTDEDDDGFSKEVQRRVYNYFKENNISQYATTTSLVKGLFGFSIWGLLYASLVLNLMNSNLILLFIVYLGIGLTNVFLAFNVVHDACHNAMSEKRTINRLFGYTMNFVGGNGYLFARTHRAHHGFVNVAGIDNTLETHGAFRFTPHEPWQPKHKWQYLYAPMLYLFTYIHWVFVKDFKWFFTEENIGNDKQVKHPTSEYIILFASKLLYFTITLVIPIVTLPIPWWIILLAWINMHLIPGLVITLLFQVTHIYSGSSFPQPDETGTIQNNYFKHILETTTDYSRESKFVAWITGGMNIHIAHHFFPQINHTHYQPVTTIIKQTAEDFGLIYQEVPNFWIAFKNHLKMMRLLSFNDSKV